MKEGPRVYPFAEDLLDRPESYRDRDVMLLLNPIEAVGSGWVEVSEERLRLVADARWVFSVGEVVNLRIRFIAGRFTIVEVGRHTTRWAKWAVSFPALLLVGLIGLRRVRYDPRRGGLVA